LKRRTDCDAHYLRILQSLHIFFGTFTAPSRCMTVRANLELETTGLPATASRQELSIGSANPNNGSGNLPGANGASNAKGLSFRDSWQAQVAWMNSANQSAEFETSSSEADGQPMWPEASAEQTDGAMEIAANCVDASIRPQQLAVGSTGTARADTRKAETQSTAESRVRGDQLSAPEEHIACKKKTTDSMANDATSQLAIASQISILPNEVASLSQPLPVAISNQNEMNPGNSTASLDGTPNGSVASVASNSFDSLNPETISGEASFPSAVSTAITTGSGAVEAANVVQSVVTGHPGACVDRTEPKSGYRSREASRASASSNTNQSPAGSESSLDRDSQIDRVSSDGASIKVGADVRVSSEQRAASIQVHTVPGTKNGTEAAGSFGIKNGAAPAESPDVASFNDNWDKLSTEFHLQFSSASVATPDESSRAASSHSISRINVSESRTQSPRQAAGNSQDAFATHTAGVSVISATTVAGIADTNHWSPNFGGSRVEETFNALESGTKIETAEPSQTRGGRLQAEAGYQDPALGWVSVRAEASSGVVHATVLSQSADAALALSGHLAGLHTYLADNRTPVETLTLASPGGDGQHLGAQHSGRGMHQDAEQNTGRDNSEPVLKPQLMTRASAGRSSGEASVVNEVFARTNTEMGFDSRHISIVV
jgi:hypothetical protein